MRLGNAHLKQAIMTNKKESGWVININSSGVVHFFIGDKSICNKSILPPYYRHKYIGDYDFIPVLNHRCSFCVKKIEKSIQTINEIKN